LYNLSLSCDAFHPIVQLWIRKFTELKSLMQMQLTETWMTKG
jgi:hypothetical protein